MVLIRAPLLSREAAFTMYPRQASGKRAEYLGIYFFDAIALLDSCGFGT
jgi:hypothetical protein